MSPPISNAIYSFIILLPFIYFHQQIAHRQQNTRYPDHPDAIPGGKIAADPGTDRKHENDAKVIQCLPQLLRLVLAGVDGKCVCAASQVADAHRARIGEAADFSKCLYLHRTG